MESFKETIISPELDTLKKEETELKKNVGEKFAGKIEDGSIETMEKNELGKLLDIAQKYSAMALRAGLIIGGSIAIVEAFVNGRPQMDPPLNAEGIQVVVGAISTILGLATSKFEIKGITPGFK